MREAARYLPWVLMGGAALAAVVWLVVGGTSPTPVNLAFFLILLVAAMTGLLAPIMGWVHRWLPIGGQPPTITAATRQAFLVGLGVAVAAWLQLNRLLDGTMALGIVAFVVLAELLIQSRTR
jgi:hypothetical protein